MASGVASRESTHVLCITIVFVPPMKISDVYSSIARFESPTAGTYLAAASGDGELRRPPRSFAAWPRRGHRVRSVERAAEAPAPGRRSLDDHDVVGVLLRLVQDPVGHDHVIDDVRLGDFL